MSTLRVVIVALILGGFVAPASASAEGWGGLFGGDKSKTTTKKTTPGGTSWWNASSSKKKKDDGFFSLVRGDDSNKAAQKKAVSQARGKKPEPQPSFWESLFGKDEPKKPQTVKEWMAQPRIDP